LSGTTKAQPPTQGHRRLLSLTGFLLQRAGVLLLHEVEAKLTEHGLRVRYFYVLAALDGPTPHSQQDLSSLLGMDPGGMVALIDEMEARGHVERRRNPQDRRRYILTLTDTGREALTDAWSAMDRTERQFLEALTVEERATLRSLLEKTLRTSWPALFTCQE
jgi:MarR family transcriptional regulator, lower aerobic nicotinate degradation pathway regulator